MPPPDARAAIARRPPPGSTLALMYHAVGDAPDDDADPHYRIGEKAFARQLAQCAATDALVSARDWLAGRDGIVLTFDDGDASHYRAALPLLLDGGANADFFVNPANVGARGFVSWAQLREMAALGMSIQSHGYEHRYLTTLPPRELRASLVRARTTIEQSVGAPVDLLAPPGGRMPADLPAIARDCGYTHVLCSRPGRLRHTDARRALPRLAVTAALSAATLQRWLDGSGLWRLRVRYAVLDAAKRALGDATYDTLRRRWLGATADGPC